MKSDYFFKKWRHSSVGKSQINEYIAIIPEIGPVTYHAPINVEHMYSFFVIPVYSSGAYSTTYHEKIGNLIHFKKHDELNNKQGEVYFKVKKRSVRYK